MDRRLSATLIISGLKSIPSTFIFRLANSSAYRAVRHPIPSLDLADKSHNIANRQSVSIEQTLFGYDPS